MKKHLQKLYEHHRLSSEEAYDALHKISTGQANQSQIASFTTIFLMRGLSVNELKGFSDVLLQLCKPVKLNQQTIDVCGTGGDGKNTFNISTLSAFVIAASGVPVAKHGNYGVSSVSGSSNVLEYLGYKFTDDANHLQRQLDKTNICFMHAPLFHPALKHAAPIRKDLGVKTFFNMLGPLLNPALPEFRMIGVYNTEIGRSYHYLLQQQNKPYAVVHSLDGYDEISTTGDFKLYSKKGEEQISMSSLNMDICLPQDLYGGASVKEAAELFIQIIKGKGTTAQHNAIIANSAIAIECATNYTLEQALNIAKETLLSGRAFQTYNNLINTQL